MPKKLNKSGKENILLKKECVQTQAEIALRQSEERYRLIAENVADLIWNVDMNLCFTYISPSVFQQRGYTVEEAMGQSVDEVIHSDHLDMVLNLLGEKIRQIVSGDLYGWEPVLFEAEQYCKDGSLTWTSNNARILPGSDGEPVSILGVTRNIVEQKKAEEELQKSEAKFRLIFDHAPLGILHYNNKGVITACNDNFVKFIGSSKEALIGLNMLNLPDNRLVVALEESLKGVTTKSEGEYISTTAKKCTNAKLIFSPIFAKNGPVDGGIGIVEDISEYKEAELEKDKLKEQLHQNQKMEAIGTLAGGITHNFNNILSGIFGYAELAAMNLDNPMKAAKNIDQIIKGAQKATELVKQILTFTRKSEHQMQPLKIFTEVKEAIKLLRSSIPTTIEIKENIASKATIFADFTQIHQIVMNLCTNAYQSMRETGGILSVDLTEVEILDKNSVPDIEIKPGNYLKLKVTDTGTGMDSETLNKIFEPYFTTKELGEGTGLGLAVTLGIIKEHNGYIKVSSKPEKGSSFTVYFPVLENNPIDLVSVGEDQDLVWRGSETIMVVDDEESIAKSSCELLEDYGYSVTTFSDGELALKGFKESPYKFDLILTDMTMPKMTGKDLSMEMLKIRDDLAIILCTGYSEGLTKEEALDLGISRYVQKPLDSQTLLLLIREVLDQNKSNH